MTASWQLFWLVVMAMLPLQAVAQEGASLERGRALYENHCVVCHTSKVHRRYPSSAIDREALQFIVKVWVEEQKLRWTPQELEDVAYYLDRVYYKFEK